MKRKKTDNIPKITALYERLSREDDAMGESGSITNQKKKLEAYAAEQGFTNPVHYTDDGHSGSSFNRPAWKQLMEDVDAGKVGTIIAKDMSRIGRNYLEVGHYTEMVLPQRGVRFIAIDNGVDSNDPSTSEFAPILNLVNEWYVKDHSEKVRMSYRSRDYAGEHIANKVLYGYKRDPEHKGHWLVDEEAAGVVRHIFQLASEGNGPGQIARMLYEKRVEKPSYYRAKRSHAEQLPERPYDWDTYTVGYFLSCVEYMGATANFKTHMPSYKSKRAVDNPREQWSIYEGTQEAIVSPELWQRVQEVQKTLRETRPKAKQFETVNPLDGYIYCSDCGQPLMNTRKREYPKRDRDGNPTGKVSKAVDFFVCRTYMNSLKHHERICSRHMIHTEALNQLILDALRQMAQTALADERGFLERINSIDHRESDSDHMRQIRAELRKAQKRHSELDNLIQGAYEANFKGNLTDERLSMLVANYEAEQEQLGSRIHELQERCQQNERQHRDGKAFLDRVRRVTAFETLTPEIMETFVDRVVVHQHIGTRFKYQQEVKIYFKFIGNPGATQEDTVHEFNARI